MSRTAAVLGRRSLVLGLAMLAVVAAPAARVAAQQAAPAAAAPAPAPADPVLTSFAKAFLAVGLVRDDFNAQLALAKNKTVEHQVEIRAQMKAKIEETIRSTGLSLDDYRRVEYTVTVDPDKRAAFDKILADLSRAG